MQQQPLHTQLKFSRLLVTSPLRLFVVIVQKNILRIKVSKTVLFTSVLLNVNYCVLYAGTTGLIPFQWLPRVPAIQYLQSNGRVKRSQCASQMVLTSLPATPLCGNYQCFLFQSGHTLSAIGGHPLRKDLLKITTPTSCAATSHSTCQQRCERRSML